MKKFKMNLVWHNCYYCPPEEDYNDNLVVTNGFDIFQATYRKKCGFPISDSNTDTLKKYWWADIAQTIRGTEKFNRTEE